MDMGIVRWLSWKKFCSSILTTTNYHTEIFFRKNHLLPNFKHRIFYSHSAPEELNSSSYHKTWRKRHAKDARILKYMYRKQYMQPFVSTDCVENLCHILNLECKDCEKIVSQPQFRNVNEKNLISSARFLKTEGVCGEAVIKAPWVLWQSEGDLREKFDRLQSPYLFGSVKDSVGFTLYNINLIECYEDIFKYEEHSYPNHRNKIYYTADRLNLPVPFFTIKLVHAWLVLHLSKVRLDDVINILLEFGVRPEDIVSDAWIFLHNTSLMRHRLRRLVEVKDEPPKLWVCRCPDFFFQKFYLRCKTKGIYANIHDLLTKLLDCEDENTLATVYHKGGFKLSSLSVIAENINALLDAGISKEFIRNNPLLLRYSTKRTLSRLKVLKEVGIEPLLYHFTISTPRFQKLLGKANREE